MATHSAEPRQDWSSRRRGYVLTLFCMIGVLNLADRQLLSILLEPIKHEFGASDTMMGLLSGMAFAIFYMTAGIPLARLADRGPRRTILAICLAIWSLMTALSGAAGSFAQLALARFGVAVGEAGAIPSTQSMLADIFPVEQRGRAYGAVTAAQSVGVAVGAFVGGWLVHLYGWRIVFAIAGLPGLAVAALLYLTVREPARSHAGAVAPAGKESAIAAARGIWAAPSARFAILGLGLATLTCYAILAWMPSLYIRVHGLSAARVGSIIGIAMAVTQPTMNLGSGLLADRLGRRDRRWYLRLPAGGAVVALPAALVAVTAPSTTVSIVAFVILQLGTGCMFAPSYAAIMGAIGADRRGTASFLAQFSQNLFGIGIGPLLVGMLSDAFTPRYGPAGLGMALAVSTAGLAIAAGLFWSGSKHIVR